MIKHILTFIALFVALLTTALPVSAHAVVKPNQAGVGTFTDFSLGVPSEKDSATIMVKLILPPGINSVTPIVKPNWRVEIINSTKQGQVDDDGNVNPIPEAIVWTEGSIPAHQKDFFIFSTQVPAKETELEWKVEQTYADGSVVSWTLGANEQPKDQKGNPDFSKFGPFSKTIVVNDLTNQTQSHSNDKTIQTQSSGQTNNGLVWAALALSAISIGMQFAAKKGK